jgi:hypothetical protein
MPAVARNQLALDETPIEDTSLEEALEERYRRSVPMNETRRAYEEADERAKGEIAKLELPVDKVVRVGRFRITCTATEGGPVAFEKKASTRLYITVVE